jgi:O-antigen ligase
VNSSTVNTVRGGERIELVHWSIILFIFIAIGRFQELIPVLRQLYLGKYIGILMILSFFFYSGLKNRISFRDSPEIVCIAVIFFLAVFGIPFSVWPSKSAQAFVFLYFKHLVFFYILARTLVTISQMKKIIFALLISSFILCAVALIDRIRWGFSRISARGYWDPNDFAFLMICILPFAVFSVFREKGIKKSFLLLTIGLIILTVIFTRSRGGFIELLIVGAFILFKTFKRSKVFTGLILIGSLTIFAFLPSTAYWERMRTILEPGDDYNMYSRAGRIQVWKQGIRLMAENPFTGVGIGVFTVAEGQSREDTGKQKEPWRTAHNSFIQIGAELGVGGLIFFVLLLYFLFKDLRRIRSKNPQIEIFKDSLLISIIGYITGGFFLSQAYSIVLYMIAGMAIALNCIAERSDQNHA